MAKLIIGQRDIDCFTFLHSHKVATAKQIHRKIFKKDYSNFCKKMRLYETLKLVNRVTGAKDFDLSGIYELTKKGFNIFRANNKGFITHNRIKSNSYYHDLFLVDIKDILEKRPRVTNYLTENQIQTRKDFDTEKGLSDFKRLNSDGFMLIKHLTKNLYLKAAMEFELSDKSMQDYRIKLSDYYSSNDIHSVFYICKDTTTEARIKKVELEIYKGENNKIYYLTYDQLQKNDELLPFTAQNSKSIEL